MCLAISSKDVREYPYSQKISREARRIALRVSSASSFVLLGIVFSSVYIHSQMYVYGDFFCLASVFLSGRHFFIRKIITGRRGGISKGYSIVKFAAIKGFRVVGARNIIDNQGNL